jgi:polyferredoxin
MQKLFKISVSKYAETIKNSFKGFSNGVGRRSQGAVNLVDFITGFTYVIGFSILAIVAMVKTKFNNRLRIILLSVTVLAFFFLQGGHLITLIPKLFGAEGVRAAAGEVGAGHVERYSLTLTVVALVITLGLTFVIGRAVCGYGCPVGALQELLYDVPTGKKGKNKLIVPTKITFFVRLGVLVLIIGLILAFDLNLINIIAPYQFWRLEIVIPGVFIISTFFVASIFVYRPFCRLFCPYGAVAAPVAKFSRFKLEKGDLCSECGLCDMKCPTGEMSERYGECYLCGRCLRTCNVDAVGFC